MNGRLKMLSSQPKRSWGDSDDENERPEFALNSEDWPPTPPKARPGKSSVASVPEDAPIDKGKQIVRSTSLSGIKPASVNSSGGLAQAAKSGSSAMSRPLVNRRSEPVPSVRPKDNVPLAPLFSRPRPASSSSSAGPTSRPMGSASSSQGSVASGSSAFAYNNPKTAASTGSSELPKKRQLPWEELEATSSKQGRTGSANFHHLNGPTGSKQRTGVGKPGELLTSTSMDIKQKVVLSPQQQRVLKLVVEEGKSVFFTGSAGTGKSVLLREIIASLKREHRGKSDAVAVTASTGMAACNIGGTTIHSFASIGLGLGDPEQLVKNIKRNKTAVTRWQRVKVLVIDEISMVDAALFDKLAKVAQLIRKKPGAGKQNELPFGGIQLVVTGDFFQLPPVTKGKEPSFAFEAQCWNSVIKETVNLTEVFRQKDTRFVDMLNEMRYGTLSEESIKTFRTLSRVPAYNGIEPTELFPMRAEVDRANQNRLRALRGDEYVFRAQDDVPGQHDASVIQKNTYLQNFMAVEKLVLKVGAQVMLIKNLDTSLVNGTIGRVIKFAVPGSLDEDEDEDLEMTSGQDPRGQAIRPEQALSTAEARKRQKAAEGQQGEKAPLIEWQTPNGPERKIMVREEFKVEDAQGRKLASRKQYPIILAWAMSIHKSQGQTIPSVKVDLGRVFEKGQSYVALSRATSLEGLQVLRFEPSRVNAHPKVVEWSRNLRTI